MRRLPPLVLLLALLAGCRTLPPPPPPTAVTPQEALAAWRARQGGIQGFQARVRLTLLAPGRSYSGNARLAAGLPSSLRVEVTDFFGRRLMTFVSDGEEVAVLFPREGRLLKGPATPRTLAAFIPPGVTLAQCVRLLTGGVPFNEGEPHQWQEQADPGSWLLVWNGADGQPRERLWLAQGRPRRLEWRGERGEPGFEAEFADFSGPGDWPRQVTVKTPTPASELRVTFGDLTVNPPLAPAEFRLSSPPGVREELLKP
ncbi:MAG: hypothetical protein K6T55_07800 [Syntrophobacterales bacterium]|nr:hypothetical protein [Syntrophobacterales bacterium]